MSLIPKLEWDIEVRERKPRNEGESQRNILKSDEEPEFTSTIKPKQRRRRHSIFGSDSDSDELTTVKPKRSLRLDDDRKTVRSAPGRLDGKGDGKERSQHRKGLRSWGDGEVRDGGRNNKASRLVSKLIAGLENQEQNPRNKRWVFVGRKSGPNNDEYELIKTTYSRPQAPQYGPP